MDPALQAIRAGRHTLRVPEEEQTGLRAKTKLEINAFG